MTRNVVLIVLATGCGRIAFDGLADAFGTTGDTGCPTFTLTVTDTADDGEINLGTYYPNGEMPPNTYPNALYVGVWSSGPTWGYFRYAVPAGTITSAHLDVAADAATIGWDPQAHALVVRAELSPDPPQVMSANDRPDNGGGRLLTTTGVRWPASGGLDWPIGQRLQSPDLTPLFAETGVVAGAHIQLWVDADFTGPDAELGLPDSGLDPARAARLVGTVCP